MRGFTVPAGLSGLVISKKLEQRFGLLGFARMLKLVELVADMTEPGEPPTAVVAWGDFLLTLGCSQQDAGDFLAYCDHARVLDRGEDDGRLKLTLLGDLAGMLKQSSAGSQVGPELYAKPEQWKAWFMADLNCPPYLANDPYTQQLYRRWCATNVTVEEMQAAVELAIKAGEAPMPASLHDHLKTVRNSKIERARA